MLFRKKLSRSSSTGNHLQRPSMSEMEQLLLFTGADALDYNPPGDGNCQFDAVANQLRNFGIHRSAQTLRAEVVSFLEQKSNYYRKKFVPSDWSLFLNDMKRDGTYGGHVTLHAICVIYNVDILVISSRGKQYTTLVSVDDSCNLQRNLIVLGHLVSAEHYVSLSRHARCTSEALTSLRRQKHRDETAQEPQETCEQVDNDQSDDDLHSDQSESDVEKSMDQQEVDDCAGDSSESAKMNSVKDKLRKNPKKVNQLILIASSYFR